MQQWSTIIQDSATIIALAVAVTNRITVPRKSGMAPPFGRRFPGTSGIAVNPVRRCLCLSIDVQGYGVNDDVRQRKIQSDLLDLLDCAAARAGLDRSRWNRQPQGDAELALIPADELLDRVVGAFILELAAALSRSNAERDPVERMRLRLAFDDGPVDLAPNGFAGQAVVRVSRLVNARQLRQALNLADRADLAVLLSDGVYRDWIHSGRSLIRTGSCRRLAVAEKEYVADAWLWLPAADVHRLPADPRGWDRD